MQISVLARPHSTACLIPALNKTVSQMRAGGICKLISPSNRSILEIISCDEYGLRADVVLRLADHRPEQVGDERDDHGADQHQLDEQHVVVALHHCMRLILPPVS